MPTNIQSGWRMDGNTQEKSVEIDADIDSNGHAWVWEPCPFHRLTKEEIKRCKVCNDDGFIYIDLDWQENDEHIEGDMI